MNSQDIDFNTAIADLLSQPVVTPDPLHVALLDGRAVGSGRDAKAAAKAAEEFPSMGSEDLVLMTFGIIEDRSLAQLVHEGGYIGTLQLLADGTIVPTA